MMINERFQLLQKEWLQITPFGQFAHVRGLQLIEPKDAHLLVENFQSFLGRLGRGFGGLPIYVGHPDVPEMTASFADHKAYGWIMKLEVRADGLYGNVKWSEEGLGLISQGHYKFVSPYWEAEEIRENGRKAYRPRKLISLGLTNRPNIPVLPLSNEKQAQGNQAEQLEFAFAQGLMTAGEVKEVEGDNEALANLLQRSKPALHVTPLTAGLGHRKQELASWKVRNSRIRAMMNEKMNSGVSYDTAWEELKKEQPELFVQMRQPEFSFS